MASSNGPVFAMGRPDALMVTNARDLVETALDNKDLGPVVRLVFSDAVQSGEGLPNGGATAATAARRTNRSRPNTPDADAEPSAPRSAAVDVMAVLQTVVEEQTTEITQICRGNAEEIARSMLEVGGMAGGAAQLRGGLSQADAGLQATGAQYLKRLEELQELRQRQSSMGAARQAIGEAIKLLGLCCRAADSVKAGQLYSAHQTLARIRSEHFREWDASAEKARAEGVPIGPGEEGILSGLGSLQPFLVSAVDEMSWLVLHRAISDFNDWLVAVRAEAKGIGMRAIQRAAAERSAEEAALAQRAALASALGGRNPDMTAAVEVLIRQQERQQEAGKGQPSTDLAPLQGIDMSPLYRCLQVHEALGKQDVFLEYYRDNRRQQLNSDLTPPANFLENYQPFIAQVVGFFMVEDRVQRGASALAAGAALDAGWESAVATLKAPLDATFEALSAAEPLLALKDFVSLACTALGGCGYHVAPLQEILGAGRLKYLDLLGSTLADAVAEALHADVQAMALVEIDSPEAAAELGESLGLPLSRSGEPPPHFPASAPFSRCVPDILLALRKYIEGAVAYLTGVVSAGELLAAVRSARDAAIRRILADALQGSLDAGTNAPETLRRTAQATANTAAVAAAMPALDDFTLLRVRGSPASSSAAVKEAVRRSPGGGWAPLSAARASPAAGGTGVAGWAGAAAGLATVQESGERYLVSLLAAEAGAAVNRARVQEWEPREPPRSSIGNSAWADGLISYLQDIFGRLIPLLPGDAAEHVVRAVVNYSATCVMNLLCEEEGVRAFNLFAVFRLHADVAGLQRFADSLVEIPGLRDELAEPAQFCELVVTGHIEEAADAARRKAAYPALEPRRLAAALHRYQEIDVHTFSLFNHPRMPRDIIKRKAVEAVVSRLRAEAAQRQA